MFFSRGCSACGGPQDSLGEMSPAEGVCGPCWVRLGEVWVEHCPGLPSEIWVRMAPGKGTLKIRCLGQFQPGKPAALNRLAGLQELMGGELREVELPWPQSYRCNRCGEAFNGMCMGSGVCYDCWGG